jgi:hypothetical protein
VWGSELIFKRRCITRGDDRGAQAIVRGGARFVRRRYFIVAPRPFPVVPLVVRRRCLIVVPRPMPEAPRMHLMVVYRPFPAAPLVVRVACTWPWCQDRCLLP